MGEEYKEDKKMKKQNKKQAKKNAMFRKLRKYVKEKYDKEIAKKEKKLGRTLEKKEKIKIVDGIVNSMGIQAMASRAAVASVFKGPKYDTILALPEAKKVEVPQVENSKKEIEEIKENITEENAPEIIEESKEEIKEEVKEENKNGNLEKEIDNIGSIKDTQEWLKEVYVKKHEEISGKTNNDLMPDAINIVNTRVAGMYKTFDGEYVTTVNKKEAAENILDEKGISYESVFSSKVYMAINEDDGTIIDCANKINDEYHKVLVAENYEKMSSDEKSVLVGMGGITPAAFYLMNLYNQQEEYQEENNKSSEFLELKIEDAKKILKSKYSNAF